MYFSDEFLTEIKYRNDIESIISRYVPSLKNRGSNMVACCPFHSEKTPSFTVFKDDGSFYCFGCGTGGDVITFMMKIENLDYTSAVLKLAEMANLPLPQGRDNTGQLKLQKRLYELNKEAALYFHENLMNSRQAMEYLNGRGLKTATIKHFGLGYALDSWDAMTQYLTGKGYTYDELKTGFLSGVTKKGGYIDYFRGRIIFPILDVQKRVIGFGGRSMGDDMPKYLNSSDTPVYKKSYNLYAMNFAKSSGAGSIILCEGYMDVIALHQAGFTNAVATLGTAVTGEQVRLISKYTGKVLLCYDSDDAGRRATEKAAGLFRNINAEVRILNLPGAKDPDEFIKNFGKERFANLLDESRSYFDEKINNTINSYNIDKEDEKIKASNELCRLIAGLDSEVEREVYGVRVAEVLNISNAAILREIEKLSKRRLKTEKMAIMEDSIKKSEGYGDYINTDYMKSPRAAKAEETIIGILLKFPEYYIYVKERIDENSFFTEFNKRVYSRVVEELKRTDCMNFDISYVLAEFAPEEHGRIIKMKRIRDDFSKNDEEEIDSAIKTLTEEKEKNVDINKSESDDEWAMSVNLKRTKIKEEQSYE